MLNAFRKIRDLLDERERRKAVLLFFMMLVVALLETIGIASIMPFISVVANPEIVESKSYLSAVYHGLGFTSVNTFLIAFGAAVFVLTVGSLAFKALTHWAMARFAQLRNYTLSSRLLRGYMRQPYSFFLNRHSADMTKSVLSEVNQVINGTLMSGLNLVANGIVGLFLIGLLIAVNPVLAVTSVVILGGAYSTIYLVLRGYTSRIGVERVRANQERFKVAQEALGGIKEVKMLGLEDGYLSAFRRPSSKFARTQAASKIIGELPQYVLQALLFGGMLILIISLLATGDGNLEEVLPAIAVYALAGTRLLPALQKVYRAMTSLRFGQAALEILHRDIVKTQQAGTRPKQKVTGPRPEPIRLHKEIQLEHINYTYPGAGRQALVDLSIAIPACTTVGFVGSTGAGKTTAVDVILGLLEPQQGRLLVDGNPISGVALRAWQRNIGYVPQSIFLVDDTVAANIALGQTADDVDFEAVEQAARVAKLHDFIVDEMPNGYHTFVGDRGIRLSGGQRQRVGIARALYHDPDVLVFDEATSALDNITERAVMEAVYNLSHRKTILLIAHRLTTVRKCDWIFMLEHGRLLAQGNYDQLLENKTFKAMAVST
jgi:ABC-type multidrug transport system fused ATPase/permease subunit